MGAGGWASRPVRITPRSWAYSGLLGVDFYRQARRILPSTASRAGLGIFPCSPWSAIQILTSCPALRRPNRTFREHILNCPKVMAALPRVLLRPLQSFDSSRFCFPRASLPHRVTSTCRAMYPSASKLVAKYSPGPDRPAAKSVLPGIHVGFSEGHGGAPESAPLSSRIL